MKQQPSQTGETTDNKPFKNKLLSADNVPLHLLLVEDNPADADLLQEMCNEIPEGIPTFMHVESLADARQALSFGQFDLILLDHNLPDSNGLQSINEMVTLAGAIPVVMISEIDDEQLAMSCINSGVQDYICKKELSVTMLRRTLGYAITRLREARIRELQATLAQLSRLSTDANVTSKVTRSLVGFKSLKEREPPLFDYVCQSYRGLFKPYLRQLLVKAPKPTVLMSDIVSQLGASGAGPKDLIDVHMAALEWSINDLPDVQARAYAVDGRLLCLEMMGLLTDYFRLGSRSISPRSGQGEKS